jgi:hypothetical protein
MSVGRHTEHSLLQRRREALVHACDLQRQTLGDDVAALRGALSPAGLGAAGARLKLPLLMAAGTLGIVLLRRRRLMPLLMAAASLWRNTRAVLPLVRRLLKRGERRAD